MADLWRQIKPDSKIFSSFDLKQGYHKIPIDPLSKNYFGIVLESGQYRYNSAPQGFAASEVDFVSITDKIFADMPIIKEIDDCLIQGNNEVEVIKQIKYFYQM